jgi:hypothetical protein
MRLVRLDDMVLIDRPGHASALVVILTPVEKKRITGRWELYQCIERDDLDRDNVLRLAIDCQIIQEKEVYL